MAKNGFKMTENCLVASHMIKKIIFSIFWFFNFFSWVLYQPCILDKFEENSFKNRVSEVPKEKS